MYNTLLSVALFALFAVSGVVASFAINTPKFTECQPASISWSPGTGPYNLVVLDASNPCGDPILDLGELKNTSISWTVEIPANSNVVLYVEDSGTEDAWSGPIHVQASNDQTCLPESVRNHYNIPSSASSASGSTLVVPPSFSTSSNPSASTGLIPVGAANAGTNPLKSGALSIPHASKPLATISAFIAAILLSL